MFSDVSRVKFRLEKISINGFRISKENAVKLFKQQESLKQVCFGILIGVSSAEYTEILRSTWMLPKLESFWYGESGITDENLSALSDIRDKTVTRVVSGEYALAEIDGRMFEIFPNLKSYKINYFSLKLKDVPSQKLKLLEGQTMVFVYQPPLANFDQEKFESDVKEHIICRSKQIVDLNGIRIGRNEWIEQGIRLSNDFWKKVIEILPKLEIIGIYNSGDVKGLILLIIDSQRNFRSVTIRTDAVGLASVAGMELPWWLEVGFE
jgi:hypothetical protein